LWYFSLMTQFDTERLNTASQKVIGEQLPTPTNVFARLNELDPPQGERIEKIANHLAKRGIDRVTAENMAIGVGLGILLAAETANPTQQ
jgi:hypothetical protein